MTRNDRRTGGLIAALLVLAAAGGPAHPQTGLAVFRSGDVAEVPVTIEGDHARLQAPGGPYRFPVSQFRLLIEGGGPEADWASHAQRATSDDGRLEAAWWALEHGLIDKAESVVRSTETRDAEHQDSGVGPLARMRACLERLDAPCPSPPIDPLLRTLGGPWNRAESAHVLLVHQADSGEAAERLALLETVLHAFYLSFSARGLSLDEPRTKLVSVWFPTGEGYRAFLRREGASGYLATQGYFHPSRQVVFTYDLRSEPRFRPIPKSSRLPATERQRLRFELERREIELGAAVHELIHQLTHASALAPRHESFPAWLHEGLAMQFEVVRGGRWCGVGRLNPLRLKAWRTLPTPPSLAPLLLPKSMTSANRYGAAWALVYYLRKTKPDSFQAWLDRLRVPVAGEDGSSPHHVLDTFRSSFGADLEMIEKDWHRFMKEQSLPWERSAAE